MALRMNRRFSLENQHVGPIVSVSTDKRKLKKQNLLCEIREGLKDVSEIRRGKAKSYKMSDLLTANNSKPNCFYGNYMPITNMRSKIEIIIGKHNSK
jgi:hypothetical protein